MKDLRWDAGFRGVGYPAIEAVGGRGRICRRLMIRAATAIRTVGLRQGGPSLSIGCHYPGLGGEDGPPYYKILFWPYSAHIHPARIHRKTTNILGFEKSP